MFMYNAELTIPPDSFVYYKNIRGVDTQTPLQSANHESPLN